VPCARRNETPTKKKDVAGQDTVATMGDRRRTGTLARCGLAASVACLMCALPLRMRLSSLPVLLRTLTAPATPRGALALDEAVAIVARVCQWRGFSLRPFPRSCLRQSLALFCVFTRMGYPVTIHFGVQTRGAALLGHSWVTLNGRPLAEPQPPTIFAIVYSYPLAMDRR